jgi:cobalt-zinc-cadmium efflux system membrane fusion protein
VLAGPTKFCLSFSTTLCLPITTLCLPITTLCLLISLACNGAHANSSSDEKPAPTPSDGTLVIDERMLASIKVDAIAEHELTNELAIPGKVQFDEDRLARVLVPVAGQIVDLHVKVGDVVRKGQRLCSISSRDAAAAFGEDLEAHRDLDLAEKNAAMTQDLFDHEAASRIALQQAQNDLAKARARVARTDETLRVLGLREELDGSTFNGRVPVTSPIGGVVIDRKVTDGQFVQTDATPIITLADLSNVWVLGDVFERDLRLVAAGQKATIATAAYPGEIFFGTVNYISESIDPATRTAKVRVSVANSGNRLKPEMFASIALAVERHERAVSVPARAVITENAKTYVYVQTGPRHFVRRLVDVAQVSGDERRVLAGVARGDRVVVDGVLLLRQEEDQRGS